MKESLLLYSADSFFVNKINSKRKTYLKNGNQSENWLE